VRENLKEVQMSLAITMNKVVKVLLADGKWHQVRQVRGKSTFAIDAYEFIEEHKSAVEGIPVTGAMWSSGLQTRIVCPLTSILAVMQQT